MSTIQRNKHGQPTGIKASKYGIYEFTGEVIKRSKAGKWVQILLDEPFEEQNEVRLWGAEYNLVLPMFVNVGAKVKFRANVNPQSTTFQNKFMNFRLVWNLSKIIKEKTLEDVSIQLK